MQRYNIILIPPIIAQFIFTLLLKRLDDLFILLYPMPEVSDIIIMPGDKSLDIV
jgi:hypothetical protein